MRIVKWLAGLVALGLAAALYFSFVLNWNYALGDRAGWVQKLSRKGWFCKTWEGELALVSLPGSTPEKFLFTIHDDAVAAQVTAVMGKRVSLEYVEKVGLPTSCFGDTRHFVTGVRLQEEIPLAPGVVVPSPRPPAPLPAPRATSQPTSAPSAP